MHDTAIVLTGNLMDEERLESDPDRRLEMTTDDAMCSMRLDLHWKSEFAHHTDCQVVRKLNLWRDIFPSEIESELISKPVGHVLTHKFAAGKLIDGYNSADCFDIADRSFNRRFRKNNYIEPRAGRFYPKGFIAGVKGIFADNLTPFRVAQVDESLTVDLNHPLAPYDMTLTAKILDIWAAGDEHGGICHDVAELVTTAGAGMQTRWQARPTDFWSDIPFTRFASDADEHFYAKPRFVNHMDSTALRQVEGLYERLLPRGGAVLDLMTSWNSHLPASLELRSVAGLGMNQEEMDANPVLCERLVHDLNIMSAVPYENNRFDAVICTVSVEYLVNPVEVFAEVNRVLKPGGRFILTFSNRWFPPKVVRVWEGIHEFERMGLVLEYFHKAGGFTNLESWSLRGLPRPADDKYADKMANSDPVYAVWGDKG